MICGLIIKVVTLSGHVYMCKNNCILQQKKSGININLLVYTLFNLLLIIFVHVFEDQIASEFNLFLEFFRFQILSAFTVVYQSYALVIFDSEYNDTYCHIRLRFNLGMEQILKHSYL